MPDYASPVDREEITLAHPRSPLWPAARRRHLKAQPRCAVCDGTAALNVHHVRPYHLFPELELAESNLLTLCEVPAHNCHLVFGHLMSFLAWNPDVREDAAAWRQKIKTRPAGRDTPQGDIACPG